MTYMHYVKLIRDASIPLDNVIHRLTDEGHALALRRTQIMFDQMTIFVTPHKDDRDVVFGVYVEEFSKAGWAYGSKSLSTEEDPARPVVGMSFSHPRTKTRLGERPPVRPGKIGFEIPLPDPSTPLHPSLIDYYAEQAANITRGLMAQQVVDEEGKMPGTPGQGGKDYRPPTWEPTVTKVEPRPLNEIFSDDDEEDE